MFRAMGIAEPTLASIMGWGLAPVAWSMGVPWGEAQQVGGLLGTQVIATEFVAYARLGEAIKGSTIARRSLIYGARSRSRSRVSRSFVDRRRRR